jgi:hypothetical protein
MWSGVIERRVIARGASSSAAWVLLLWAAAAMPTTIDFADGTVYHQITVRR